MIVDLRERKMADNNTIVSVIDMITKLNGAPCKKTLQKIVFLIEAKKVDLGCDFGIHFYGPYSADLDFAVRQLCDEGILDIEYTAKEHLISVVDQSAVKENTNDTISEVIASFGKEAPVELELIATALYVYQSLRDKNKIKDGVKKIKGTKYSDSKIESAILKLIDNGYIAA